MDDFWTIDGEEDDFMPLVVDVSDVQNQMRNVIEYFLKGRWDVDKLFKFTLPLFEETSNPVAEQVMGWIEAYSLGIINLSELKRCLDECRGEMKNAGH